MSDLETSHEGRKIESEQYQERQKRKAAAEKKAESWYEAVGQKVVKKTRSPVTGNVSSVYVGKLTGETAKLVVKSRKG